MPWVQDPRPVVRPELQTRPQRETGSSAHTCCLKTRTRRAARSGSVAGGETRGDPRNSLSGWGLGRRGGATEAGRGPGPRRAGASLPSAARSLCVSQETLRRAGTAGGGTARRRVSPASAPSEGRGWPFPAPSRAAEAGPAGCFSPGANVRLPTAPGKPRTPTKGISLEFFNHKGPGRQAPSPPGPRLPPPSLEMQRGRGAGTGGATAPTTWGSPGSPMVPDGLQCPSSCRGGTAGAPAGGGALVPGRGTLRLPSRQGTLGGLVGRSPPAPQRDSAETHRSPHSPTSTKQPKIMSPQLDKVSSPTKSARTWASQ